MRLTLHDNVHPSGGQPQPRTRPPIPDATRAAWVTAMHKLLERARSGDGTVAADLKVGAMKLRMRATLHGAAASVVWSVGADERPVAASVLFTGEVPRDDAAALAEIRNRARPLPFDAADYDRLSAERRPCLGTLYLDAAWYDSAWVELAATAVAVAALSGPDGRMTEKPDIARSTDAYADPAPAGDDMQPFTRAATSPRSARSSSPMDAAQTTLEFDFSRDRLQRVLQMAKKKADAAINAVPGIHFRVYPPQAFLDRPGMLDGAQVFDNLKLTTWRVRWYDGEEDQLSFGEFLGFIDQVVELQIAFQDLTRSPPPNTPAPLNHSVWHRGPRSALGRPAPVKVRRTLNTRDLITDSAIRRLFDAVSLETDTAPVLIAQDGR